MLRLIKTFWKRGKGWFVRPISIVCSLYFYRWRAHKIDVWFGEFEMNRPLLVHDDTPGARKHCNLSGIMAMWYFLFIFFCEFFNMVFWIQLLYLWQSLRTNLWEKYGWRTDLFLSLYFIHASMQQEVPPFCWKTWSIGGSRNFLVQSLV